MAILPTTIRALARRAFLSRVRYCNSESEAALHIMTPARMVELRCPHCHASHWEIDSDYRGADLAGGVELSYPERDYFCPHCKRTGPGYAVLQKSPPEFFLQPHPLYPMSENDFAYWVEILRQNFPDDPMLADVYKTWRPSGGAGLRRILPAWLRRLLAG